MHRDWLFRFTWALLDFDETVFKFYTCPNGKLQVSSLLTSQKIQKVTIHCSIFLICVTFNNLFPTSCLNSLLLFQNVSFFSNHFLHIASGLYFCLIIFCYQTKNVYSFLCNVSHKFPPQIKVQNNRVNPIFFTGSNALQPVPSFNTHTA